MFLSNSKQELFSLVYMTVKTQGNSAKTAAEICMTDDAAKYVEQRLEDNDYTDTIHDLANNLFLDNVIKKVPDYELLHFVGSLQTLHTTAINRAVDIDTDDEFDPLFDLAMILFAERRNLNFVTKD